MGFHYSRLKKVREIAGNGKSFTGRELGNKLMKCKQRLSRYRRRQRFSDRFCKRMEILDVEGRWRTGKEPKGRLGENVPRK